MDNLHQKLSESMRDSAELDTKMIAKLNEIIGLYQDVRKVIARRRRVSRMIVTAIKRENKKRVRLLVGDWREATAKINRYKL